MTTPATGWLQRGNLTGPEGPQGPQGVQGTQGVQGEPGPQGVQGPPGIGFDPEPSVATVEDLPDTDPVGTVRLVRGPGNPTQEGPAGHLFAYQPDDPSALASGWVDMGQSAYVGPQGPQGPQGVQGEQGPQGPAGADGADGATGATGPTGPTGAAGVDGTRIVLYAGAPPAADGYPVGTVAIGANGDLLEAI